MTHEPPQVDLLMGIILPYVNFAIFLGLAIYFFKKPAAAAALKKKEDFERILKEATHAKTVAETKFKELDARRASLDSEMQEMKATAARAAEADAERIVADAKNLAEHLKTEARRIAEAEILKARDALRREIVESVKAEVEGRIRAELSEQKQIDLVCRQMGGLNDLRVEG